ncbi:AAA family ATPase [Luteolibacter marinus]|uniref:AAA family ATPase n=1 Tax=Luteolibacter marinus TaxID=2776705 RepID=UPI001866B73C
MLFDRLCLHNFQRYAGDFEIQFPDPKKHAAFVVILAPNNTGKTTIIRALKFLLYGELPAGNPWELVNDRTRDGASIGDNVSAWVEARIRINDDDPITVRRSLTVRRIDDRGRWVVEGPALHCKKSDNRGEKYYKDDGFIQSKITRAVPEDLFSWFYFHGEPAGGKMAHGGADGLRESLQKVIQLQRWDDSERLAEKLAKKIESEIATEVGANREYQQIQSQLETVQNGLKKSKEDLRKCENLLSEGSDKLAALEARTDELAAAAAKAKDTLSAIRKLENSKATAEREADSAARGYRDRVAKLGGLPFLQALFDTADIRLEGLRKKNLLPAEVSKPFIERLIKQEACVCGRPHDDAAILSLREYLKGALATQTNSDLLELSRQLDPANGAPFRQRLVGHSDEIRRLREVEGSARRRASETARQLDELHPPDDGELTDFESLLKDRRILSSKLENIRDKKKELEHTATKQEQAIKAYRNQLSSIGGGRRGGKVPKLNEELGKAQNLLDAIREGKDRFEASVASVLKRHLSQLFDNAVTSGNTASISSRTFLPVIRTSRGTVEANPGGGEKQVLELAFVIALSELRREINQTVRAAGLGGNLLGPQSFVLDSPFTSVDPNYMRVIAEFLPGKARQMIVLVAKQNWHDTIREALEDHVTMAYAVTLHTSSAIKEPDAYRFVFRGKKHDLLVKLPGKETPFTSYSQI